MAEEIQKTLEILGEEKVRCLKTLYDSLEGLPPQIDRLRYRVKHKKDIDILDQLEHSSQLIRTDRESKNYRIPPYTLPLLQNENAEKLIQTMNSIYEEFKKIYEKNLASPISFSELRNLFIYLPEEELKVALHYMSEAHDVWSGLGNNFPFDDSSTITISESVLKRADFSDVLKDYFRWHFINPQKNLTQDNLSRLFTETESSDRGFFHSREKDGYPEWFDELGDTEKALIVEIDRAMKGGLSALPLMGTRALLENIIVLNIGDQGSFKSNLKKFVDEGFITKKMSDVFDYVFDAGSAVIHRSHIPLDEDVKLCVDAIVHLFEGIAIHKPNIDEMHKKIPKREYKKKDK